MVNRNTFFGFDELRNSAGVLVGPLGFGFTEDWEILAVALNQGEVSSFDFFWDDQVWDQIEVVAYNMVPSSDNIDIDLLMSTDGSTFHTAAASYEWAWNNSNDASGGADVGNSSDTRIRAAPFCGFNSQEYRDLTLRFNNVSNSGNLKSMHLIFAGKAASGGMDRGVGDAHLIQNTNSIRGFSIDPAAAATFTFDKIIVRGRRLAQATIKSQDDWVVITDEETVAAAATHDFFWDDNVFDEIEVTLTGVRVGTNIQNLECRFSSDGSTFHSGGTDYKTAFYNFSDAGAGGANAGESSTGASTAILAADLGDQADEFMDGVLLLTGVSNSLRKQKGSSLFTGIIHNTGLQSMHTSIMDMNTNDRTQGIQLRGQGSTTVAFDRVRIRGRRLTPIGVLKQDWELIEEQIVTSGVATIDFTDIPSAEFDEFELAIKDVDTDTTGNNLDLRFSSDNGATYKSGASDYGYGQWNMSSETAHSTVQDATAAFIRCAANFGSASDRLLFGTLLLGPLVGASRKHVRYHLSALNDGGNLRTQIGAGVWVGTDSDGDTTAFQLLLGAGGNFSAGSKFTLRGRRKVS